MSKEGAGDVAYLWDAYQKGLLHEVPEDMSMEGFVKYSDHLLDQIQKIWIVEDFIKGKMQVVAIIFSSFDGWQLEPHVIFFDIVTTKVMLRVWIGFLKMTKYSDEIGCCLIKVDGSARRVTNRIEKMGLLQWVGKIWQGRPGGNEYLYSMRCRARGS